MRPFVALTMVVLVGTPPHLASAQDGSVRFEYGGSTLQVWVQTGGASGSAELVDGNGGDVIVSDHGRGGSAFRLSGEVLSVENRSGAHADYLIAVPPDADIALTVDGRSVLAVGRADGRRQVIWSWPDRSSEMAHHRPRRSSRLRPSRRPYSRGGYATPRSARPVPRRPPAVTFNAFVGGFVTDSVDVIEPARVRSLKILLGGEQFVVRGDRSVRFRLWANHRWGKIMPGSDGVEITVELPKEAQRYGIRMGGELVWELRDGEGRAYCDPVAEIRRRDGRMLWLFTLIDGELNCTLRPQQLPAALPLGPVAVR